MSQVKDKLVHIGYLFHIILFHLYKRDRKTFRDETVTTQCYYGCEFSKSQEQKAGKFHILVEMLHCY